MCPSTELAPDALLPYAPHFSSQITLQAVQRALPVLTALLTSLDDGPLFLPRVGHDLLDLSANSG